MECYIDYVFIGKKIRRARKSKLWTQARLAEEIGCSTANITNIEKAKTMLSLNMLVRIIDVLELSADEILGRRQAPDTEGILSAEAQIQEIWKELSYEDAQFCRQLCVDFCTAFSRRCKQV